ncbi:MAG: fasciclin domain-containing protein [bacterium]|jgi:uncharacterized surface protein with fasciclin (FAS1) repeats
MRFLIRIAVPVIALLMTFSVRSAHADDLFAVLKKTPELSTLAKLIEVAGLSDDLKTAPVLTLLAPTNDAFAKLPKEQTEALLKPENKATLRSILLYHALAVKFSSVDIRDLPVGSKGPSVAGPALELTSFDPPTINGVAKVIKTDINADNGVIHEIDAVLLPPSMVKKAPAPVTASKSSGEAMTAAATETLAATLDRVPELSMFAALVKKTGLGDSLVKRGPLTIFAPTNAAIAKAFPVLPNTIDDKVTAILMRHAVAGAYSAADLTGMTGQSLPTVQRGATLKVTGKDGKVLVNGVPVVKADLAAKNGIIHIVDGILPQ